VANLRRRSAVIPADKQPTQRGNHVEVARDLVEL
jgi:hypothetical protein